MCLECKARRVVKQRRSYGDDSVGRFTDGGSVHFSGETRQERHEGKRYQQTIRTKDGPGLAAWDRGAQDANERSYQPMGSDWTAPVSSNGDSSSASEAPSQSTLDNAGAGENRFLPGRKRYAPLEEAPETISELGDSSTAHRDRFMRRSRAHTMDYKAELPRALLRHEADPMIACLATADEVHDLEFLRSIPSTTYSEIIRTVDPSHFVSKLGKLHQDLSPHMADKLHLAPMWSVAMEYVYTLLQVLYIRRSAGIKPTFSDYMLLLRSARDLGNRAIGITLWNMLLKDGFTPNTTCYNYYMSTVIWNGIHSAGPRRKDRVIPFNMMQRSTGRNARWRKYLVGGPEGIRQKTMSIFDKMRAHGTVANEESFRILVTAAAREGDLSVLKTVLNRVWGIDVDAIMSGKDENKIVPKRIPRHSPLMPTSQLLFTVAHAFGINNDIPCALRVVDFIARHFDLEITPDVWHHLLQWTYVLSVERSGTAGRGGRRQGQLPKKSVQSLWNTMTSRPYCTKPTMSMYNYLIGSLAQQGLSGDIEMRMNEAYALFWEHQSSAYRAFGALSEQTHRKADGLEHQSIDQLRRDWELCEVTRRRDVWWLKRWVRRYMYSLSFGREGDYRDKRFAYDLPPFMWQWRTYLPGDIFYETTTGFVEFVSRSEEEMVAAHAGRVRRMKHRRAVMYHARRRIGQRWLDKNKYAVPKRFQRWLDQNRNAVPKRFQLYVASLSDNSRKISRIAM